MNAWQDAIRDALISGTTASLLSTVALAVCGRIERNSAAAPNSAPSQWVLGEQAAYERHPALAKTALGYFIHHAMSIFWANVHTHGFGRNRRPRSVARHVGEGAATAALACLIDYTIVPKRFRPGFEKHLCKKSLFAVYVAFGLGLALPDLLRDRTIAPRRGGSHGIDRSSVPRTLFARDASKLACSGATR